MNVGDIESFMGDGVGVRYQIFGPGRALATAGTAADCEASHLNVPRERRTIAHAPQGWKFTFWKAAFLLSVPCGSCTRSIKSY